MLRIATIPTIALPSRVIDALQVIGASLFIAICAEIRIPLFFTPVPFTLQTFAILLVASVFGSKKGSLAVLGYIFKSYFTFPLLLGQPFALAALFGPNAGYIYGFIVQAYLTGLYFEHSKNSSHLKILSALIGICVLELIIGSIWLATFVGWQSVILMGIAPFVPGEILKSIAVTAYHKKR